LANANQKVVVRSLDLADQRSIATFVAGWKGPLHILVNNAGIMALPSLERTSEGWEMQFATNFLGHFERRKTTAEGAATSVLLAASPLLNGIGGRISKTATRRPLCTGVDGLRRRPRAVRGWIPPTPSGSGRLPLELIRATP